MLTNEWVQRVELKMAPYPDLNQSLPANFITPSRTSRILRPGIVFASVLLLGAASVVGLGIGAAVLVSGAEMTKSTNAVQALTLIASSMSIVYVFIHGAAAKYNDPVGTIRPPESNIHATCFILARLALVVWMVVFITACAIVSKPKSCMKGTMACRLQIADVVASIFGFIATGVILTALESCKYPFEMPHILATRKMHSRGSPFGNDILDQSVSRESSFDAGPIFKGEKPKGPMVQKSSIKRKPLPRTSSEISGAPERPLTPLLLMSGRARSGSRSWGEEWTHLAKDSGLEKKSISTSDSAASRSYQASSGASEYMSTSDRGSHVSMPRRAVVTRRPVRQRPRSRTVTPSSSISNLSRRSPLSSVRSADYPHILVRPELRYCPPKIPPPHGWHSSRTSSISQLVPVADIQSLQRRRSFGTPEHFGIRGPRNNLPPLSRRRTNDMKVPGAFIDYEGKLEEYVRKIEVEYMTRSPSKREHQVQQVQHPGQCEKLTTPSSPNGVDSKARYRERKPVPAPTEPEPEPETETETEPEPVALKAFRRLSLGDISSGLGNLAGLGKMFD